MDILIIAYTIYTFIKLFVSYKQVSFVKTEQIKEPIFLKPDDYTKAASYTIKKEKLSQIETIIDYSLFLIWVSFGFFYLSNMIDIENQHLKAVIFILSFLTIGNIVSLPISIYNKFYLDKEFGFSNITLKIFITDMLKGAFLFYTIGALVVYLLSIFIVSSDFWWLYSFITLFFLVIVINILYPVIRAIMFDKFKQLEDIELKTKIEELLKSVNFKSSGIFSVDASKRDNRLNAYFGGLGKTKRVVLFDTLIKKLTHNELLAVLGHELGHFKNRDIIKNIAIIGFMLFIVFFAIEHIPYSVYSDLGLEKRSYLVIAMFILIFPMIGFFIMPFVSFVSRNNEYNADLFGSNLAGANNLKSALIKLVNENLHFPKSHYLYIFFYYSHPPISERIKHLDKLIRQ